MSEACWPYVNLNDESIKCCHLLTDFNISGAAKGAPDAKFGAVVSCTVLKKKGWRALKLDYWGERTDASIRMSRWSVL